MARPSDFKPGDKVFHDSLRGLIPAIVVGPADPIRPGLAIGDVRIRYTATRGAFRRGEIADVGALWVVKREWVRVRGGQYHIYEPRRPKETE